jgi:hypothetical protein
MPVKEKPAQKPKPNSLKTVLVKKKKRKWPHFTQKFGPTVRDAGVHLCAVSC